MIIIKKNSQLISVPIIIYLSWVTQPKRDRNVNPIWHVLPLCNISTEGFKLSKYLVLDIVVISFVEVE